MPASRGLCCVGLVRLLSSPLKCELIVITVHWPFGLVHFLHISSFSFQSPIQDLLKCTNQKVFSLSNFLQPAPSYFLMVMYKYSFYRHFLKLSQSVCFPVDERQTALSDMPNTSVKLHSFTYLMNSEYKHKIYIQSITEMQYKSFKYFKLILSVTSKFYENLTGFKQLHLNGSNAEFCQCWFIDSPNNTTV